MTSSPAAVFRRPLSVGGLLVALLLVAALALLGTPRAAHADPVATCAAPSDVIAHPGRTRLIYAGCTPNTAVPASVTIDPPAHGTAGALSSLTFQYTAAAGYTGPVSFTVHPVGADGQAWPAFTVAIDVSATRNTPPNCGYGSSGVTARAGSPVTIALNACDDAEGDPVTIALTAGPDHGTAGPIGPGAGSGSQLTYTSDPSFSGGDTIGYAATDDYGDTSPTATVGVDVRPLGSNQPPVCYGSQPIGLGDPPIADAAVFPDLGAVYLWCVDPDGDPLTLTFVQPPVHGTVAAIADSPLPGFTYTPIGGYTGLDSLVVVISDGQGGSVRKAMTLVVGNHAPECGALLTITIPMRTSAADPGVTIPEPCADPEGDQLTASLSLGTRLSHGAASFDATADTITYTPDVGFSGEEWLDYHVDDGHFSGNFNAVHIFVGGPSGPGPQPAAPRAVALPPSAQQRAATQAAKLLGTAAKPLALGLGTAVRAFATGAKRVAPGDALVTVSCATACTVGVAARLTLTPQRHGAPRTTLTLAHRAVKAKAGHTAVVRLVLTKAQRARVAHARRTTVALALRTAVGKRVKTVHSTFTVARR
jgi:hypothetical protein